MPRPGAGGPQGPAGEEGIEGEDYVSRVMGGGAGAPRGMFNPKEISQLKDVMILTLAQLLGSDLDKQIGEKLAKGEELDPGQLQHILDEARNAPIPESHGPLMQKIFSQLSR